MNARETDRGTSLAVGALALVIASLLPSGAALAGEAHTAIRWELGLVGGLLDFLAAQPFVLLFLVLGVGTYVGRLKVGFFNLGSTASTLLVGIVVSAVAFLLYDIRYEVPALLTTVTLNLFMFAVGLKVGPQFFAGLRSDGLKFVVIALIVVLLNFAIVFGAAKMLGMAPGSATGLIAGSMTDTAVIGAATGAVQSGTYQPPAGVTGEDVIGNVAAGYAIVYLFSLIGIILLIRYLPRIFRIDIRGAAREAEESYGGKSEIPVAGTQAAYVMPRSSVDVRAYRVEDLAFIGMSVKDASERFEVPVLKLMRAGEEIDLRGHTKLERGDIVTIVTDVERLVRAAQRAVGPEVADEAARKVDLEVADIVVTKQTFVGTSLQDTVRRVRETLMAAGEQGVRMLHPIALLRAGEPMPAYPATVLHRGDILRVIGPSARIDSVGSLVGTVVRASYVSDIVTLALGLAVGYVFGYFSVEIGGIPISLGTPAGVMLAGIAISTLRSRFPLFGGPVSEGARSLLQDLGLDLFIAAVAVNTAPNVVKAFSAGGVGQILAVGITASIVPPLVAWFVGWRVLRLNAAVLLGALAGARFCTPALRAAQEEAASSVPAVGYPVGYAVTAVLVLIGGYLALFL